MESNFLLSLCRSVCASQHSCVVEGFKEEGPQEALEQLATVTMGNDDDYNRNVSWPQALRYFSMSHLAQGPHSPSPFPKCAFEWLSSLTTSVRKRPLPAQESLGYSPGLLLGETGPDLSTGSPMSWDKLPEFSE